MAASRAFLGMKAVRALKGGANRFEANPRLGYFFFHMPILIATFS